MPKAGDRVVVAGNKLGSPTRVGTLVKTVGTMIRVRWENGTESLFQPAAGSVTYQAPGTKIAKPPAPKTAPKTPAKKAALAKATPKKPAAKAKAAPAKKPATTKPAAKAKSPKKAAPKKSPAKKPAAKAKRTR